MAGSLDTDGVLAEAVRLGIMGKSIAERARASYRDAGVTMPFDEFLVEQGLLSPEQRLWLARGTEPSGAREEDAHGPVPGEEHSGWTLESKLGEGGMGTVWLARRADQPRPAVVKFLAPSLASNPSLRARFAREGQILSRLAPHPHLVRVLAAVGEAEKPHIVMELLDGHALDELLRDRFSLPWAEAARMARDVAAGLAEIHRHGIIHRDVKPANVIFTSAGEVKILDFGLAKDLRHDDGISKPGMRLGTPHYMAPEQWGNHVVDARCDLFALGATLYHLLVGEPPFLGKDAQAVARKSLRGEYTAPALIVRDLPEDLGLVVAQLLQTDRTLRYADAGEVLRDLQRVLDKKEVLVPRLLERRGESVSVKRHALVPGALFQLGRSDASQVMLRHPSVSGEHATIRREGSARFVLSDKGSTFGTFVGETRVARDVTLRSGDVVRLGKVVLEFRHEAAAPAAPVEAVVRSEHPPIAWRTLEPIVEALVDAADRRTVLYLIDALAPRRGLEPWEHFALASLTDEATASRVAERVTKDAADRRVKASMRLAQVTGEEHGADVSAWLAWWDEHRTELPPQVAVREPRPLDGVSTGEGLPGSPTVWLPPDAVIAIGRDESCALRLSHQSVSRVHARLYRFPRGLVVRDEGSRFGTIVNEVKAARAFVGPGDRIEVANVAMTLVTKEPPPAASTLGTTCIDGRIFDALEALEHPAVLLALARFRHQATRLDLVEDELRPLFPAGPPPAIVERVGRAYRLRADRARVQLVRALGLSAEDAPRWRQVLTERRASLPRQVMPWGWFPDPSREESASSAQTAISPR